MATFNDNSRRNFLKYSSLGLGATILDASPAAARTTNEWNLQKLPFEITVATIDARGLSEDTTIEEAKRRLQRGLENVAGLKPNMVCLPDIFSHFRNTRVLSHIAEPRDIMSGFVAEVASFAKTNKCFVTLPVISKAGNKYFSSTISINDKGKIAGIYDKVFPSYEELTPDAEGNRISPGKADQPIITSAFSNIALLMGDDAYHPEIWKRYASKGVKFFVYSGQFSGGRMLNYYAVSNHCYVVSSTIAEGRIVDISGNDIDKTSEFIRYSWANVNIDRTNILTFPNRLPELFRKYGQRLRFKVWGNTDMLTIESRDPALKVTDVLNEFKLPDYAAYINAETKVQDKYRPNTKL